MPETEAAAVLVKLVAAELTAPPLPTMILIELRVVSVMLPPRMSFALLPPPAPKRRVSVPELLEVMLPLSTRAEALVRLVLTKV